MTIVERQYNFLDLANFIVPMGWVFLANKFHYSWWLFGSVLLFSFFCVNYRISFSSAVSDKSEIKKQEVPFYASPGAWLVFTIAAYLGYLLLQSRWLLEMLLMTGAIGVAVASLLRDLRRHQS